MEASRENTFTVTNDQNHESGGTALPVMRNIQIPAIRNNPYSPKFKQYNRSRSDMPQNQDWQQMPKVQNNNQYYNNQQYIQVVYPVQNDVSSKKQGNYVDELSKSRNNNNNNNNLADPKDKNSKFVKIAKKNYLKDQNLNYSLLEKKYLNRNYSEEKEDEEYIYLYKESNNFNNSSNYNNWGPSPNRNETPETAKLEIYNLYNQVNLLKNENYFLNQKVYELNHEVIRLQKLNLQFTNYIKQNEMFIKNQADEAQRNYTTSFNVSPASDAGHAKTKHSLISKKSDSNKTNSGMDKEDLFNMEKFIDETLTEFDNYK